MNTTVYMCQYQDSDLHWHDGIRIESYYNEHKVTIIDLLTHEIVTEVNDVKNQENWGCFVYTY